ncbi:MAG: hypothetical protein FWH02_04660 [Oscillospiraceae bacterium]|nr:hypothetical protein [Oscillospiraceae bacterium]
MGLWNTIRKKITDIFSPTKLNVQMEALSGANPGRRLLSEAEVEQFENMLFNTWRGEDIMVQKIKTNLNEKVTVQQAYTDAKNGNYAAFENLPPAMRNAIASIKMNELRANGTFTNPAAMAALAPNDPALRLGFDYAGRMADFGGQSREFFSAKYDEMTQRVFEGKATVPDSRRLMDADQLAQYEADLMSTPQGKKLMNEKVATADSYFFSMFNRVTVREAYELAKNGDYRAFENLPPEMRNAVASRKMLELEANGTFADPAMISALSPHDTALRLGLSHAGRMGTFAGMPGSFFENLDNSMTKKVFTDTFTPMTADRTQRLQEKVGGDKAADMIKQSDYSQGVMLKMMYASQMGRTTMTSQSKETAWGAGMSDMFTTGARTGFILPRGGKVISAIYGKNWGEDFGNKGRAFATHSVRAPAFDGSKQYKEQKGASPFGQYGLNIPAGGLGNRGTSGRTIVNDGSCGHLYSHIKPGDTKHHSTLLVGVESDAPLSRNFQGHYHGPKATPESHSCFGAQKTSLIGDKYGGRTVDLRGIDGARFVDKMNLMDKYIKDNQRIARTGNEQERTAATQRLESLTQSLTGKKMSEVQLSTVEREIGEWTQTGGTERQAQAERTADPFRGVEAQVTAANEVDREPVDFGNLVNPPREIDTNALEAGEREITVPSADRR